MIIIGFLLIAIWLLYVEFISGYVIRKCDSGALVIILAFLPIVIFVSILDCLGVIK